MTKDRTNDPFEWLTSPQSLLPFIEMALKDKSDYAVAVHMGCGSSSFGEFVLEQPNVSKVINVDVDANVVQAMQQRSEALGLNMQFACLDFRTERVPADDASIDLVLDKSTLDCTLCSDTSTAALLFEVYRILQVNGTYLMVSFHQQSLLRPLLELLPWTLQHYTMERQVESLSGEPLPPHQGHKTPLNVFLCTKSANADHLDATTEQLAERIHQVNDVWFQQENPLLTGPRKKDLYAKFGTQRISLRQAYDVLFTDGEKEHLTYDNFLEDWRAFGGSQDTMDIEQAIRFLQEMQ